MDKVNRVKEQIENVFGFIDISPHFFIEDKKDKISVEIEGENLNFLIGYRGESLLALQNFLNVSINKDSKDDSWSRIVVDINGYRQQRESKIEDTVRALIDRVRFFGKEVEMSPMSSSERYFVHEFVSDYDDVISESAGEKSNRHVVLKPANTSVDD
jgi:spoIIIJ-associated protein